MRMGRTQIHLPPAPLHGSLSMRQLYSQTEACAVPPATGYTAGAMSLSKRLDHDIFGLLQQCNTKPLCSTQCC